MMSGGGFGGGFGGGLGSSLGGIFQGIFGDSGAPYEDAGNAYKKYFNQGTQFQNPFYQAGTGAIGGYQDWLGGMKDPSGFINNLMKNYQQSPWAKYSTQQGIRAGQNAASAGGLTGSTPFAQQLSQNAQNISSQDMQNWLGNVLGINSQYGQGLFGEMGMGQHAGDILSQMYQNAGQYMGDAAYGQEAGKQQDQNALWGGVGNIVGSFL